MVKRVFSSIALMAALIPFAQPAAAQNYQGPPKPTILDYGPPSRNMPYRIPETKAASGQCGNPAHSCLFYGGDFVFNPLYPSIANGLANEDTLLIPELPTEPRSGFRSSCQQVRLGMSRDSSPIISQPTASSIRESHLMLWHFGLSIKGCFRVTREPLSLPVLLRLPAPHRALRFQPE